MNRDPSPTMTAEAMAARLSAQLGSRALAEARYRLSLAEARFQVSLAKTGKDLAVLDQWAAVSRLLMDEEAAETPVERPAARGR